MGRRAREATIKQRTTATTTTISSAQAERARAARHRIMARNGTTSARRVPSCHSLRPPPPPPTGVPGRESTYIHTHTHTQQPMPRVGSGTMQRPHRLALLVPIVLSC